MTVHCRGNDLVRRTFRYFCLFGVGEEDEDHGFGFGVSDEKDAFGVGGRGHLFLGLSP